VFGLVRVQFSIGKVLLCCILAKSGEFFCPSLIFFVNGTTADAIFGEDLGSLLTTFFRVRGSGLLATAWAVFHFQLLGCLLCWGGLLVATEPKFTGVKMVSGHPLLPGCSAFLRHVDAFDVLLGETIKNFVSSSGRTSASSCILDAFLFQSLVR
jgi:hypothetical protein